MGNKGLGKFLLGFVFFEFVNVHGSESMFLSQGLSLHTGWVDRELSQAAKGNIYTL